MSNNKSLSPKINAEAFFNKIKPLSDLQGEITDCELKILSSWIYEAGTYLSNPWFVQHCLVRLVSNMNKLSKNLSIRNALFDVLEEDPDFLKRILDYSENSFENFNPHEFSILLNGLVHLGLFPSSYWMDQWFLCSQKKMKEFSTEDMYKSLNECVILNIVPPTKWMHTWFNNFSKSGWPRQPHALIQMVRHLQTLNVEIDAHWLKEWSLITAPLLKEANLSDIVHASDCIILEPISNSDTFMCEWFKSCALHIKHMSDEQIKHVFHQIVKAEREVPICWIESYTKRMITLSKPLTSGEIAHTLYGLACLQISVLSIQLLLEKCREYFLHNKHAFDKKHSNHLREVLIAQEYFKTKNFNLKVDSEQYSDVMQILEGENRNIPDRKIAVFTYLCQSRAELIKAEQWVAEISNKIDFLIESRKLIIEIYGAHHFDEEKLKQRVKLKHYLLQNAGYSILSLDSRKFGEDWHAYVDQEVSSFLDG